MVVETGKARKAAPAQNRTEAKTSKGMQPNKDTGPSAGATTKAKTTGDHDPDGGSNCRAKASDPRDQETDRSTTHASTASTTVTTDAAATRQDPSHPLGLSATAMSKTVCHGSDDGGSTRGHVDSDPASELESLKKEVTRLREALDLAEFNARKARQLVLARDHAMDLGRATESVDAREPDSTSQHAGHHVESAPQPADVRHNGPEAEPGRGRDSREAHAAPALTSMQRWILNHFWAIAFGEDLDFSEQDPVAKAFEGGGDIDEPHFAGAASIRSLSRVVPKRLRGSFLEAANASTVAGDPPRTGPQQEKEQAHPGQPGPEPSTPCQGTKGKGHAASCDPTGQDAHEPGTASITAQDDHVRRHLEELEAIADAMWSWRGEVAEMVRTTHRMRQATHKKLEALKDASSKGKVSKKELEPWRTRCAQYTESLRMCKSQQQKIDALYDLMLPAQRSNDQSFNTFLKEMSEHHTSLGALKTRLASLERDAAKPIRQTGSKTESETAYRLSPVVLHMRKTADQDRARKARASKSKLKEENAKQLAHTNAAVFPNSYNEHQRKGPARPQPPRTPGSSRKKDGAVSRGRKAAAQATTAG